MLDKDDEKFIVENYDWLVEQVKDIEVNSYKSEKFCNVKGCDDIVPQELWGMWILCKKHKKMCETTEGYRELERIGYKNEFKNK